MAPIGLERFVLHWAQNNVLLTIQDNISPVVVLNDAGFDIGIGNIAHHVHMGNKSNYRTIPVFYIALYCPKDVTILVHVGIFNPNGQHFLYQGLTKRKLLWAAGKTLA